ncbi:MAG: family 43 glycosylhydrolase, partial [Oscillospiraceae bacterium]|nr:family 43 glycosylhydrolase [Oscillospiraceae bacterium]
MLSNIIPANAEGELEVKDLTKAELVETAPGTAIDNSIISSKTYKSALYNNPISSEVFCADPTAVEYNGRLYVYGTNDHQQCREKGEDKDNTYEKIKSLVVFSTDDMVNWVYHGEINVGEIAPWIMNSWAPTITSRVEEDGLTHFYLYFSNNGTGTGVITSTDPLGPWEDPLGKALVQYDTEGLTDCPNPFDPGVVIDDNGVGWLSFGAGKAKDGTDYMPGSARIVKLGKDMISFDSDFTEIPAPYLFEASELNYINGTYVYTYNCDWSDHTEKWDYDCPAPSMCSMVYMTTKTPLDPESWEMKGECFQNPGLSGLEYSNNHTHMHKYKGKWYMFYHTLLLKRS